MSDDEIRFAVFALLQLQVAATLYMAGLIWFVQLVHYPLMADVRERDDNVYQTRHMSKTTWAVGPPMLLELAATVFLLLWRPASMPFWQPMLGLLLLALIWLSTALLQVPCHRRLAKSFDRAAHRRLVKSNWIRTVGWSLRSLLVLWMLSTTLQLPADRLHITSIWDQPMAKIKVGDRAPEFTATTQDGKQIKLSDYIGEKTLVLFFYPKDDSPVCTKQACAFRDSYESFQEAGAEVIGISSDSSDSHQGFISKHKLNFPLVSDKKGELRKLFGVGSTWGLIPGRTTYVIDKEGIVRLVFSAQFASDKHVHEALAAVNEQP